MTGGGSPRRLAIAVTVGQTLTHFVMPQVAALRQAGWEVHLVAAPPWEPPPGSGVVFHPIPMSRGISPAADAGSLARWYRLLRRIQPDTLLGSTPKAGLLSMVAGRAARVPRRVFLHRGARWETLEGPTRAVVANLDRVTMAAATDVLAVSPSLSDLVVAEGLTKTRPTVLGNGGSKGVDLERFSPGPRLHTEPTLGFLGRLSNDKGLEVLLEVQRHCRASLPTTRLLVGGVVDPDDPPSDTVMRSLSAEEGVTMLGRVEDAPTFFRSIDVLVFPSLREGLPNVVIEAAACGVPAVGWDVTGVRDAISPGVSGIVAPLGAPAALGEAAMLVLRGDSAVSVSSCRSWSTQFDQDRLTDLLISELSGATTERLRDPLADQDEELCL